MDSNKTQAEGTDSQGSEGTVLQGSGQSGAQSRAGEAAGQAGGDCGMQRGEVPEERRGDPRVDVEAMLKCYGLKAEEMRDPHETMASGGLRKMWAVHHVLEHDLISQVRVNAMESLKTEYQRLIEEEEDPRDPQMLKELRAWAERQAAAPKRALWKSISGLGEGDETEISPDARNAGIIRLINFVLRVVRAELNEQKANPRPERSYLWDPLPQICVYLGIARAKLSRYTKEVTGMAAHELVDKLRAVDLRGKLRVALAGQIGRLREQLMKKNGGKPATPEQLWNALRALRRSPAYNRETWAMGLGFANYRRLYRASLLCYGLTPGQLEFALIGEMNNGNGTSCSHEGHEENGNGTNSSHEDHEEGNEGHEENGKNGRDGVSQRRDGAKNGGEEGKEGADRNSGASQEDVQFFTANGDGMGEGHDGERGVA